jgi:hypothetical protein
VFQELITYSQALTIADGCVPFTAIGGAVPQKIAASCRSDNRTNFSKARLKVALVNPRQRLV